jgi:transposase
MKWEADELRRRVKALGRRTRGARLPEALRRAIGEYAREQRRRGEGVRAIAQSVGVSTESIRRWASSGDARAPEARTAPLVPIVVRDGDDRARGEISVCAPGGYRVEGLTVAAAAELLRRLA